MILWTAQPVEVVRQIQEKGFFICDPSKSEYLKSEDFQNAYHWLVAQMDKRIKRPDDVNVVSPIWAWYRSDGKREDMDLKSCVIYPDKDTYVLEIDIPDNDVVLSDLMQWQCVFYDVVVYKLNTEASEEDYHTISEEEIAYVDSLTPEEEAEYKVKTWERVFYNVGDAYIPDDIQACFWILRKENIKKVTFIPAGTVPNEWIA